MCTGGRYRIQNFYSGALRAERESIEAVKLGTLDLTMTSTGPVPNFVPEVDILDIPFLFKDHGQARRTLDGPLGAALVELVPFVLVIFACLMLITYLPVIEIGRRDLAYAP